MSLLMNVDQRFNSTIRSIRCSALVAVLTVAVAAPADASSFLDKLKELNPIPQKTQPQEKDVELGDPAAQRDALTLSFATSYRHLLTAQMYFAEAFGLKDQASLLKAERDSLSSGAVDRSSLKKVKSTSVAAQKQINAKMDEEAELDAEGRELYAKGLLSYVQALATARETVILLKDFQESVRKRPWLLLNSQARAAAYVVKEAPGYFSNLNKSSRMALTYAKRNKIKVPKDATSLMDD